jgi:hypothetical protein
MHALNANSATLAAFVILSALPLILKNSTHVHRKQPDRQRNQRPRCRATPAPGTATILATALTYHIQVLLCDDILALFQIGENLSIAFGANHVI